MTPLYQNCQFFEHQAYQHKHNREKFEHNGNYFSQHIYRIQTALSLFSFNNNKKENIKKIFSCDRTRSDEWAPAKNRQTFLFFTWKSHPVSASHP